MPTCFGCLREFPVETEMEPGKTKGGVMFHGCHRSDNILLDQETGDPIACSIVFGVPHNKAAMPDSLLPLSPTMERPKDIIPTVPGKEIKPVIGFGSVRLRDVRK